MDSATKLIEADKEALRIYLLRWGLPELLRDARDILEEDPTILIEGEMAKEIDVIDREWAMTVLAEVIADFEAAERAEE